jgi:hypothetical protein
MRRLGDLQIEAGTAGGDAESRGRDARAIEIYTACSSSSGYARADVVLNSREAGVSAGRTRPATSIRLSPNAARGSTSSSPRRDPVAKRYAEAQMAYQAASAFGASEFTSKASASSAGRCSQSENEASFDPSARSA